MSRVPVQEAPTSAPLAAQDSSFPQSSMAVIESGEPSLWKMESAELATKPYFWLWLCQAETTDFCPFGKGNGEISVQSLSLRQSSEKGKEGSRVPRVRFKRNQAFAFKFVANQWLLRELDFAKCLMKGSLFTKFSSKNPSVVIYVWQINADIYS